MTKMTRGFLTVGTRLPKALRVRNHNERGSRTVCGEHGHLFYTDGLIGNEARQSAVYRESARHHHWEEPLSCRPRH